MPPREEHRDHRVRLREVEGRRQRRQERVLRRQAADQHHAPVPGGAARGHGSNATAVDGLRALQELWLESLAELKWTRARPTSEYKARVAKPYDDLRASASTRFASRRSRSRQGQAPAAASRAPTRQEGASRAKAAAARPRAATWSARRRSRRRSSSTGDATRHDRRARRDLRRRRHARAARCPASASARSSSRWRRPSREAIAARGAAVAEAGTGTGKTFAYLVPALLYGGKVIVSTGTKTLQDQLFERDLPLVRDALRCPVTIALLKGRANYVCHHHLERTAREGPAAVARGRAAPAEDRRVRARVANAAIARELADVPENASIWPLVTSTRDNCLGAECALPRRLLRAEGAQGGARGRRRRRQPSPVLRRRDAARRRASPSSCPPATR